MSLIYKVIARTMERCIRSNLNKLSFYITVKQGHNELNGTVKDYSL